MFSFVSILSFFNPRLRQAFLQREAWFHSLVAKPTNSFLGLFWIPVESFLLFPAVDFQTFQPQSKMFISSMAKKRPSEKDSFYNLRPLPSRGTRKRNPDEDFILRGRQTPVR